MIVFILQLVYLDYGMKEKNPIDNVRFYMKDNPNEPIKVRKDQVSRPTKGAFNQRCGNSNISYLHRDK